MRKSKQYLILTLILISIAVVTGITTFIFKKSDTKSLLISEDSSISQIVPLPEETKTHTLHIRAVGDNLIHSAIYNQARERAVSGVNYDFTYPYQLIESYISEADLSYINQEVLITDNLFKPSSYPLFNSPPELGDHMLKIGFDLFSIANNHIYDKGEEGYLGTIDYWSKRTAATVAGGYPDENNLDEIPICEKNGIKVALLSYTESTNGNSLPLGSVPTVIKTSQEDRIEHTITLAKRQADIVIVAVHWGNENSTVVDNRQIDLAHKMTDWGADIILGSHPHVLQKIEELETDEGNKSIVIYSLGNFISTQELVNNMFGGILDIKLSFEDGEIIHDSITFIPTITYYEGTDKGNVKIVPLSEFNNNLVKSHGINNYTTKFSMAYINNFYEEIIGEKYLEKNKEHDVN